jgi:hypothetical protein
VAVGEEQRDEKDQVTSPAKHKQVLVGHRTEVTDSRHDAKLAYQINAVVAAHAAVMHIISNSVEVAEARRAAAPAIPATGPSAGVMGLKQGRTPAGKDEKEQVPGCRCTIM